MNIAKQMLLWGISVSCLANLCADIIPSSELVRPAGCLKTGENEYMVGVAKRAGILNTTPGIVYTPEVKKIAGKAVSFSADMRCTGIESDAKGDHVGGKILISYKDGTGRMRFYATKSITGTVADWQKHTAKLNIPADAREVNVTFGIQQGWGTLDIKNPAMDITMFELTGEKAPLSMSSVMAGPNAKINGDILTVTVPKRAKMPNTTTGGTVELDLTNLRGKEVTVSGKVRYDVNSDAQGGHVGAKVLVTRYDSSGRPAWLSSKSLSGKSDEWCDFSRSFKVLDNTGSVSLIFGLQQAYGKAEFRDITVSIK